MTAEPQASESSGRNRRSWNRGGEAQEWVQVGPRACLPSQVKALFPLPLEANVLLLEGVRPLGPAWAWHRAAVRSRPTQPRLPSCTFLVSYPSLTGPPLFSFTWLMGLF